MSIEAASLLIRVGADTKSAENDLNKLGSRLGGLFGGISSGASGASGSLTRMFETAGGVMLANGIQAATGALLDLGRTALDTYAYTERLQFALQAMGGRELVRSGAADNMAEGFAMASDRAAELKGWIEQLAVFSPFNVHDVADAFRLAQAYGFTGDQAQRLTTVMTDFAAGTGQTGFTLHRASLALGQMQQRGKVASQELNQLSEAGINAREILGQAFGKSTAEITKMVENGLVPADVAIEAILRSLEKDYAGMAEAQSGTFQGLISSLEDFRDLGLRDIFAGTFKAIQPYLQSFVTLITSPAFRAGIIRFGDAVGAVVGQGLANAAKGINTFMSVFNRLGGGLKGFTGGIAETLGIPEFVVQLGLAVAAIAPVALVLGTLVTAAGAVGTAFVAVAGFVLSPLGLISAAIIGLGAAWTTNFLGIQDATASAWASMEPTLKEWNTWLQREVPKGLTFLQNRVVKAGGIFEKFFKSDDMKNFQTKATGIATDVANTFSGLVSGKTSFGDFGQELQTALGQIPQAISDLFGGVDFASMVSNLQWADFIPTMTWDGVIGNITWGDFVGTLNWSDKILTLSWGDYVFKLDWNLFVQNLNGWAVYISKLDWGLFVTTLLSWAAWIPRLAWSSFVGFVSLSTFVTTLIWDNFITKIDWALIVTTLTDWTVYITHLDWGLYITGITDWAVYITKIDWATVFPPLATWGTYITKLDWGAIGLTAIDWAMWIPALAWTMVLTPLRWGLYIASFVWSTVINPVNWTNFISAITNWDTWIKMLSWATLIQPVVWGTYLSHIDWGKILPVKFMWESFVTKLDWLAVLPPFAWPVFPPFNWATFVSGFKWPDIKAPEWATYIFHLSWPAILPPDWLAFIPPLVWPNIPPFPGWDQFVGFVGGLIPGKAKGGQAKGLTIVGEKGPELAFFGGNGADILSNPDSIKFLQSLGLPGFAAGTMPIPPMGPVNVQQTQPVPRAQWATVTGSSGRMSDDQFQKRIAEVTGKAMTGAADKTSKAFEKAAKKVESSLTGMLQKVPGLFSASPVTQDQLDMAKLGVPQNFVDDWLRHLTDEVVNGVQWNDADIKDAALRAGLDPGLPAEVILKMVTAKWNDSSLFADPKNLDLLNMGAVADNLRNQQAAALGQQNLMGMFGIAPDKAAQDQAAMTDQMINGLTANIEAGKVAPIGQQLMTNIASGMGNVTKETTDALTTSITTQLAAAGDTGQKAIADTVVGSVGDAFTNSFSDGTATDSFIGAMLTQIKSDASVAQLEEIGKTVAEIVFNGWKKAGKDLPWADGIPPAANVGGTGTTGAGAGGTTGTAVPNASGSLSFGGGYTVAGEDGPELVRLRRGARIWDAQQTAAMLGGGSGVTIQNVTINNGMDAAELGHRIQQAQRRRYGK